MSNDTTKAPLPDPFTLIWRWLNSLPIAIGVMLALAVLSALGTVIPQEHLAQPPMGQTFEAMLSERFGGRQLSLIMGLGLHHIYFTWYFFLLLLWVSVSAIACNITRFKKTISLRRNPPLAGEDGFTHSKHAVTTEEVAPGTVAAIVDELKKRHFRVRVQQHEGAQYLYADQGFTKLWGLMLLHLAILILLAGGIYGKVFGVEGMIALADGEQKTLSLDIAKNKHPFVTPLLRNLPAREYNLSQDRFRIDYDRKIELPAMIAEHVQPEIQDYYRYFVKQYVSNLKAEALQTSEVVETEVSVNHPLVVDKLNFYQSSYRQRGYIEVAIDGETKTYEVVPEQPMMVTRDGCYLKSMGAWFSLDPADNYAAVSADKANSPQVFMCERVIGGDLYVGGEHTGFLGPMTIARLGGSTGAGLFHSQIISPEQPLTLTLADGSTATVRMSTRIDNTSIFSYKRDPGIPVLYFGWIAMIVGITLALYIPFTQVRLRVAENRGAMLVTGARSRLNGTLKRQLRAILEQQ